jgi:hypothetical protein
LDLLGQGGRLNLDAQIDNYANTRHDLIARHGEVGAVSLLRGAVFSVTMGSNDFINNYLMPIFSVPERAVTPPPAFVSAMIAKYRQQLTASFFFSPLDTSIVFFLLVANAYAVVACLTKLLRRRGCTFWTRARSW